MEKQEHEISLTEWVHGLGQGIIIAPEYNLEITEDGVCAGDCRRCNKCNMEVER